MLLSTAWRFFPSTVILFSCLVISCTSSADVVSWSTGTDFISASGHQNISTTGMFVEARNFGGPTATVNQGSEMITFVEDQATLPSGSFSTAGGSAVATTDTNWEAILHRADWNSSSPLPFTLSGLTPGDTYQLELFVYDNRSAAIAARTFTFDDGLGNISPTGTNGSGISTIGTFTPTTSTLTINAAQSANAPTANAMVLRNITTVPEPSSLALIGLGIACWARRRR